jgi:hypothetical protein
MRVLVVLLLLLACAMNARAETYERLNGESAEAFVRRVGPAESELAHPVIETDVWRRDGTVIVAFYRHRMVLESGEGSYDVVSGYAFIPEPAGRYRRILVGHMEPEGGDPEIRSVFFANADKGREKELAVIVAWDQHHYDVDGTLYGTFIYAGPGDIDAGSFVYLEEISRKVSGACECGWRDGRHAISKFKTAAEVKARLRKLGYK